MDESATVQGILRRFLDAENLDAHRRKICGHLLACRTEALGGLMWRCDHCADEQPRYHACRDRHCPQCQGRATRQWSERQRGHLLPVTYYHVVFTLPHTLNGWIALHPEVLYRRAKPEALGRRAGHDGGTAHLGPESQPARASALPAAWGRTER